MPITINGSGTVTGISAGGLPDGIITRPEMGYAGAILQVVSTTKTDHFTTASTSFTDVTGLSVAITPSASANKILVFANVVYGNTSANENTILQLVRNSTAVGNGASGFIGGRQATSDVPKAGIVFLDTPSSTSSLTYTIQIKAANGTAVINRRGEDTTFTFSSDITVMEVAG